MPGSTDLRHRGGIERKEWDAYLGNFLHPEHDYDGEKAVTAASMVMVISEY